MDCALSRPKELLCGNMTAGNRRSNNIRVSIRVVKVTTGLVISKIGSRLIAFVGLVLIMCVTACARSPIVPTATELEKVSLDTRVDVISRLVALNAGREFDTLPQVSIATSTEVATQFTAMYRPYTDILLVGVPKENHVQVLGTYARSLSDLMLGVYFLTSDSVLLVDSTIGRAAQDAGLTEAENSHLQMLVLAHELTHALQQQIAGAQSKLLARTDEDAINAYGAVLEGHAMRVQRLVAADLGIEDRISDVVGSLTAAKGKDVCSRVCLSAFHLFWRHVGQRAEQGASGRQRFAQRGRGEKRLGADNTRLS